MTRRGTGAEGTVEETKAQLTLTMVREALSKCAALDVAVELTSIRNHEFKHSAEGMTIKDFGLARWCVAGLGDRPYARAGVDANGG